MTDGQNERRSELEAQLRLVDAEFDREMRERGFELAQAENVALPTSLARLYAERESIKAELEELTSGGSNERD
jgi:hypothetical protein